MSQKPQLTVNERIKAAYLHYVLGIEQQAVAVAFEVNIGRVNEACLAIKQAAEDPKHLQELASGQRQRVVLVEPTGVLRQEAAVEAAARKKSEEEEREEEQ